MTIERINHNQIRFIFKAKDLMDRNIDMYEIIHRRGGETTQNLFKEITGILQSEYDFSSYGTPLIFEASMTPDNLNVLVTRVSGENSPASRMGEVLDSLINHIHDMIEADEEDEDMDTFWDGSPGASLLEMFKPPDASKRQGQNHGHQCPHRAPSPFEPTKIKDSGYQIFSFPDFDTMADAASFIDSIEKSRAYKLDGRYYLAVSNIINVSDTLSEHGKQEKNNAVAYAQLQERGQVVINHNAIAGLKQYNQI